MRSFLSTILLAFICIGASFGGGAAWTAYSAHQARVAADLKVQLEGEAIAAVRSDPAACSRQLPEAADLCAALARYDLAAQAIAQWAETPDRPDVMAALQTIRTTALRTESPSWVSPLLWSEEAVLRRAKALEAASQALLAKQAGAERTALSAKLANILKEKILQDTNTP